MDNIQKMQRLIEEINKHNINYYVYDNPTISDAEYDKLYYSLVDLEKLTGVTLEGSPTLRVGDTVLDGFTKKQHEVRLYSLNKVRDLDDLKAWFAEMNLKSGGTDFALEYKFDGLQLVLEYDNGIFQNATTRGNGIVGEDVTAQVRTIKSVPLKIKFKNKLIVQGEGMMLQSSLAEYNKTAEIKLKNARNGVAGAIRNLDPKETAKRKLDYFCYSILKCDGHEFLTQKAMHEFLVENGFKTGEYFKVFNDFNEIVKEIDAVDKIKGKLDMLIDGMVIKINKVQPREQIGWTNKFPKWAIAFKFEAQELSTLLQDVIWQVGRSGRVTPIACLDPVELAGATVSRATLNNIEDIQRKNISIGSRVFVRRSNEVIPEVMGLAEELPNAKAITHPETCPSCGEKLTRVGPLLFCTNHFGCREQVVDRISHFASRNAFNIEGFSEKTAKLFYDELGVRKLSDLFEIKIDDLLKLPSFKQKKADNIINSIEKSKNITFNRFLFALGISEVGDKTAKDLANEFDSLNDIQNASIERLASIRDVGEVIALKIREFFDEEYNLKEIEKLFEHGVKIKYPVKNTGNLPLKGKTIVLTGTLPNLSRNEAEALIESLGGRTSSSVSKNTDFCLLGENPGSKYTKAKALGIQILTQEDLIKLKIAIDKRVYE